MPLGNALRGAEILGDVVKSRRESLVCSSVLSVSIFAALASAASAHSARSKFETTNASAANNNHRFV